jgi:hypothetical protein
MRKIIGAIGATLAIAVLASSAPAAGASTQDAPEFGFDVSAQKARTSAALASASGSWMVRLLPYIEQDNLYRAAVTPPTWSAMGSRSGGEVITSAASRQTGESTPAWETAASGSSGTALPNKPG